MLSLITDFRAKLFQQPTKITENKNHKITVMSHNLQKYHVTLKNPFAAAKKMFEFFREILYSGSYKQKNESY